MAVTLRLRRGSTVPAASGFVIGEPAWDGANGRLYVKSNDGNMVLINPEGVDRDYGSIDATVVDTEDYGSIV